MILRESELLIIEENVSNICLFSDEKQRPVCVIQETPREDGADLSPKKVYLP